MTTNVDWYHVITSILVICNLFPLLRAFLQSTTSFAGLLFFEPAKRTAIEEEEEEKEKEKEEEEEEEEERGGGGEVTIGDIGVVLRRLGMVWKEGGDGSGVQLTEAAREVLEEKTASLEELEEAFYVFDRNEDGFISREEVWCVMRRLGWRTVSLDDCGRMIRAYDGDGDGKINFCEFRKLLENAV